MFKLFEPGTATRVLFRLRVQIEIHQHAQRLLLHRIKAQLTKHEVNLKTMKILTQTLYRFPMDQKIHQIPLLYLFHGSCSWKRFVFSVQASCKWSGLEQLISQSGSKWTT